MPVINYILLFLTMSLLAQPDQSKLLEQLRWKHRVVLLQYDVGNPEMLQIQLDLLGPLTDDYLKRKLLIIKITDKDYSILNPDHIVAKISASGQFESAKPIQDFSITLIGLDGSDKFKSSKPISKSELFERIHRMPMRQTEIKGN